MLTQLPDLRGLHLHFAPLCAVQVLVCFFEVFQVEVLRRDPFVRLFFEPLVVRVPCYLAQPLEHIDCSLVLSLFLQRLTQVQKRPHLSDPVFSNFSGVLHPLERADRASIVLNALVDYPLVLKKRDDHFGLAGAQTKKH